MMIGTLSEPEIFELTGKSQKPAQVKQLRAMGIRFLIRADDTLVIARAHVENLLGVSSSAKREPELRL